MNECRGITCPAQLVFLINFKWSFFWHFFCHAQKHSFTALCHFAFVSNAFLSFLAFPLLSSILTCQCRRFCQFFFFNATTFFNCFMNEIPPPPQFSRRNEGNSGTFQWMSGWVIVHFRQMDTFGPIEKNYLAGQRTAGRALIHTLFIRFHRTKQTQKVLAMCGRRGRKAKKGKVAFKFNSSKSINLI